ncbi:hypothetical protein MKK75_02785, partial [Methylobacterium sp. J-030]|uniref:hypothetical protein n=1 Tax=Methylobacterium sp. J-030 TaxID=2836627 RepID=UPI001FB90D01
GVGTTLRVPSCAFTEAGRFPLIDIRMSQDNDGRWTVYAPGLVVTDLTREGAEAFAAIYRRVTGS